MLSNILIREVDVLRGLIGEYMIWPWLQKLRLVNRFIAWRKQSDDTRKGLEVSDFLENKIYPYLGDNVLVQLVYDYGDLFFCVSLGHQIILSRPHASDYDLPVISSLKSGAVGSGVVSVFLRLLSVAHIIYERRTGRTQTSDTISSPISRAFVAIMILAATVGMACLSAVAGALIINFAGEQSLTPCHSAYAGAVASASIFVSSWL